ncbi:hypothetical protein IC232_18115 [Microvirga sp. BT688]|uniref:hypothetical protein n=1 Tax=Microvirga sp. TaxID=1873136 RepID=UPI001683C6E1|nr:hypothetical protein [Microvirga sp.]MBD2748614.1 hypothetical protein [Microvirga sp.]
MKQTSPRYTFSEAILAALIGAIIYSTVSVLLIHGTPDFMGRLIAWLKIVLPIAVIGLPLVGVPLARGLKRIRQDGVIQGMALGAFIGALVCIVVVSTPSYMLASHEGSTVTLLGMHLHVFKTGSDLYLGMEFLVVPWLL